MKSIVLLILVLSLNTLNLLAQGYICAIGGGTEAQGGWSDAPYSWIVQKSGNGKVVILSASTSDTWLQDYFLSLGASSASTLVIDSRTKANDATNENIIKSAKAIFIKGGDQYDYISYWKDTKTEDAIRYVYQNGGVVAGTSAGAAILSKFYFTARYGTVYPLETLQNPFNSYIDIGDDFLNLTSLNILFDTHFIERGRFGRLIGFIFNLYYTKNADVLGIGIDDATALCIYPDLSAEVMGGGSVYFFRKDSQTQFFRESTKYKIEKLKCDILTSGWKYNLSQRQIIEIPQSARQFIQSYNEHNLNANIILSGSDYISRNLNSSLLKFSELSSNFPVLIIYPIGYGTWADSISQYLNGKQIANEKLELSSSIANDQQAAQKIAAYNSFVLYGPNLNVWSFLINKNYLLAQAFEQKVRTYSFILFIGTAGKIAGDFFVDNTDNLSSASYRGLLSVKKGLNAYSPLILQPRLFENSNFYENRSSSVLWGLMSKNKNLGIYLNGADFVHFNPITSKINFYGSVPMIIFDASNSSYRDSSKVILSGSSPRNSIAIDNVRVFVSNQNGSFDLLHRTSITEAKIEYNNEYPTNNIEIYPNPFNPYFNIKISSEKEDMAHIQIFDQLGRLIFKYDNIKLHKGDNLYNVNLYDFASGIYLVKVTFKNQNRIYSIKASKIQ